MEEKEQERYYNPIYSVLFNKIKDIRTPIKNEILRALLDGQWHSELELIRVTKKQHGFVGAVTLGTMINSLNHSIKNNYLQKKLVNEKLYYKISDNYVGLTRAAYRFDAKKFF
ncbi:MAG: hypothetical protein KGD65_10470 [Candidatus Lokiarchaeota archaeon]|nr:hypothetical protein [Candidatus Lokiarchaeota archaeon]